MAPHAPAEPASGVLADASWQDPWLICLDIDGTLVDHSHRPRPSAVRAVRTARARGHQVFLFTGRSRSGISDEIMRIGFDGVASANGGFVECGDALVDEVTMSERDGEYLIDLFARFGIEYTLQARDVSYASRGLYDRMHPLLLEQRSRAGAGASAEAHFDQLEDRFVYRGRPSVRGIAKATVVGEDALVLDNLAAEIDDRFQVAVGTVPFLGVIGGEVTLRSIHKGRALRSAARLVGIPVERTLAIGDSANDIEMIEAAAIGVAMGGAPQAVIAAARSTTGTVADDGVWRALVAHGLIPRE